MECRILKNKQCEITQCYNNSNQAIDLVGKDYTLDYITTHTSEKIWWVKDEVNKYLSNKVYKGQSIIDALKEINIYSSYKNRSMLAKTNNIKDYSRKKEQNIKMLSLLK